MAPCKDIPHNSYQLLTKVQGLCSTIRIHHTHATSPAGFRRVANSINLQPVCQNIAGESRAPGVLTKAQAVTDWCLCQQHWPVSLAPHLLRNAAQPDPAGIHCIHHVAGSHVCVDNPECHSIERYLRWESEEKCSSAPHGLSWSSETRPCGVQTLHTAKPHPHTGTVAGHTKQLLHQHLHMQNTHHICATLALQQKPCFQTL